MATAAAHARDAGWTYRQINTPHDPQLFDAEGIARLMIELASQPDLALPGTGCAA
jgi:hypothetical protein